MWWVSLLVHPMHAMHPVGSLPLLLIGDPRYTQTHRYSPLLCPVSLICKWRVFSQQRGWSQCVLYPLFPVSLMPHQRSMWCRSLFPHSISPSPSPSLILSLSTSLFLSFSLFPLSLLLFLPLSLSLVSPLTLKSLRISRVLPLVIHNASFQVHEHRHVLRGFNNEIWTI